MAELTVYLDEMVDHLLGEALRTQGFSVVTTQSEGMQGTDDEAQLRYAAGRDWILLSHNQRHFARWHMTFVQAGEQHGGIILLPGDRPVRRIIVRAAMLLDWIATFPDRRSRLFRWGDLQCLLTQGYRLPNYLEAELHMALGRTDG